MYPDENWFRIYEIPDGHPRHKPGMPGGAIAVRPPDAQRWNDEGFGIFEAFNLFPLGQRREGICTEIRAWGIDMDAPAGTKPEQIRKLENSPLPPSYVVETKNGHQAQWFCRGCPVSGYKTIAKRLQWFFNSDPAATDVPRVLRVPGFKHQKDPDSPFTIRTVYGPNPSTSYFDRMLLRHFRPTPDELKGEDDPRVQKRARYVPAAGDGFWEVLGRLDQGWVLSVLSGTGYVGGEIYTFKPVSHGKRNILVDGKATSTWLDANGMIGSRHKGGPTACQWLQYFGLSRTDAVKALKDCIPELAEAS